MSAEKEKTERPTSMVEAYYKRIIRVAEYYIFLCFILIAVLLPFLLEFSWVDRYVKFIYFTAFPLLVILLIISLFKEVVMDILKRRFENPQQDEKKTSRKR